MTDSRTNLPETKDFVVPSELGTKEYWEHCYNEELTNFNDCGDEGEIWFGKSLTRKIINWIERNLNKEVPVLDLGCGNGFLLIELGKKSFCNLTGIDYVPKAIELSKSIDEKENTGSKIHFQVCDILSDCQVDCTCCLHSKFKVVIDKGTYDAICLQPVESLEFLDQMKEKYLSKILKLSDAKSNFIIASCNWTQDELLNQFLSEPHIKFLEKIETPTFNFGGKIGNRVTCLIFEINKDLM